MKVEHVLGEGFRATLAPLLFSLSPHPKELHIGSMFLELSPPTCRAPGHPLELSTQPTLYLGTEHGSGAMTACAAALLTRHLVKGLHLKLVLMLFA